MRIALSLGMQQRTHPQATPVNVAWVGGLAAVLGAFPLAALCALIYRFPIPMAGYMSGPEAVVPALVAVGVYGLLLGGFVALAFAGAALAFFAAALRRGAHSPQADRRLAALAGVAAAAVAVALLANWDHVIGPW